jgi:hypothetical protein
VPYVQQFNDLLVQKAAVPRAENAILLRPLLLNGRQFLQDGIDAKFSFRHLELRIAHIQLFGIAHFNALTGIVVSHSSIAATTAAAAAACSSYDGTTVVTLGRIST